MSGQVPIEDPPPPYEERDSNAAAATTTTTTGSGGRDSRDAHAAGPIPVSDGIRGPDHPHAQVGIGGKIPRAAAAAPQFTGGASSSSASASSSTATATSRQQQPIPIPPPVVYPYHQASSQGGIARQFPPQFALYSDGGWSRTYTLGEHMDEPLYAVKLHTGFSGEPPLVLHNGPDASTSGTLASVDFEPFSGDMTITLPPSPSPLPGSGRGGPTLVTVECARGWHRTYTFSVAVGSSSGPGTTTTRTETFEWRHSYGAAVEALDGDFDGWKLVRRERGRPPGMLGDATAPPFAPGPFLASDGLEVVAAWSDARMSISKQAKFAFVGTGETGLLGEPWAVVAVASALGIWERERRRRRRRNAA